jgi:hypothetical protein
MRIALRNLPPDARDGAEQSIEIHLEPENYTDPCCLVQSILLSDVGLLLFMYV